MYSSISTSPFLDSVCCLPRNSASLNSRLVGVRNFHETNLSSYNHDFSNTTKRMKKSPLSLPLKQSKYKWENANSRTKLVKPLTQNDGSSVVQNEKVILSHCRSNLPFISAISKGWFSRRSCDVTCTKSPLFDLQSCCFIDVKYVPKNTISANMLSQEKLKTLSVDNENTLVKLSKHKLIRKQDRSNVKVPTKRTDSSLLLRTRREVIRKTETVPSDSKKVNPACRIPLALGTKSCTSAQVSNEEKGAKKISPASLIVLTRQKLIRKPDSAVTNDAIQLPNKLISVNRNKLINSCLLKNNTTLMKSVLHHMIKERRRPYSRSSYVLLTRNKLIRRAKFKQKLCRKQSTDGPRSTRRLGNSPKTFVSVGKNKLIRKSLFSKRNKITEKTTPPFRKTILSRVLNSPSKRIQRFTNHLSRMNLKYSYIRGRSRYSAKTKRYQNRCKNNRRVFKKKSDKVCSLYRKRGICLKHTKKTCPFVHDSKFITLCQKFLKGACESQDCPLSHDLIPQKMPVCVHFLNDNCTSDRCPFLHTKPDVKASICDQFLRGYCELAEKCSNWHVYACPEYKNRSTCEKGKNCRLPHRNIEYFENSLADEKATDTDGWRYFEMNALNENNHQSVSIIPGRETMAALPDFIPL